MEQINELTKIIYSKKVMMQLLELGFRPIDTFPNPTNPKYLCWAFKWDDKFDKALSAVLGGNSRG
jgi:hypothetical protein